MDVSILDFKLKYQQLANLYNQIENQIQTEVYSASDQKCLMEIQNVIRCLLSFLLEQQFYDSIENGIDSCYSYLLRNYHMQESTAIVVSRLVFACDDDSQNTLFYVLKSFAQKKYKEETYGNKN